MSFSKGFNGGFDFSFTAPFEAAPPPVVLTEFGYKATTFGAPGGYGSSEAWVVTPGVNPTNNELSDTTYTAKSGDKITKLFVQSSLTAEEFAAGKESIAQIGIYKDDADKTLVHAQRFESNGTTGVKWNEIDVDIALEDGVKYFLAINPNGWTKWPEFNPDDGDSTVYALTTSQVLENLGGLSTRTSGWMIPLYAVVESGGTTTPVITPSTIKPSTIIPKPTTTDTWDDSTTWDDSKDWSE